MSCVACPMSLFLRAGHLGHLKNSSNLPSPVPAPSPRKSGMSPRETPLLQALLPKGDLLLLCRQDVLCVFCTLQPPQAFLSCVFLPRSGPVCRLTYSL